MTVNLAYFVVLEENDMTVWHALTIEQERLCNFPTQSLSSAGQVYIYIYIYIYPVNICLDHTLLFIKKKNHTFIIYLKIYFIFIKNWKTANNVIVKRHFMVSVNTPYIYIYI